VKKFVFLYQGQSEVTDKVKEGWTAWFAEIGDAVVDGGNPFTPGRKVTPTGAEDLPAGLEAISGYTIVNAESMDAAEKLLANCPIVTSVHVYEAVSM
jgi:hypothetical protein